MMEPRHFQPRGQQVILTTFIIIRIHLVAATYCSAKLRLGQNSQPHQEPLALIAALRGFGHWLLKGQLDLSQDFQLNDPDTENKGAALEQCSQSKGDSVAELYKNAEKHHDPMLHAKISYSVNFCHYKNSTLVIILA